MFWCKSPRSSSYWTSTILKEPKTNLSITINSSSISEEIEFITINKYCTSIGYISFVINLPYRPVPQRSIFYIFRSIKFIVITYVCTIMYKSFDHISIKRCRPITWISIYCNGLREYKSIKRRKYN